MNYLAHVYLSNTDEALTIGNLIADHVKGKAYLDYPETIQKGILLHRKIDQISPWILRFFNELEDFVKHEKENLS